MSSSDSPFKVQAKPFQKRIKVPTSKSYANRALILGAMKGNGFTLSEIPQSSDVQTMIECLKKIGLNITYENDRVTFLNSFPQCEIPQRESIKLHTKDGGTTNRFLLPLLARGQNHYELVPSGKMGERPMEELVDALKFLGAHLTLNENGTWITVQGPLNSQIDKVEINCRKSTQFATGLLLALSDTKIELETLELENSKLYFEMTKSLVDQVKKSNSLNTPVDFSSLGYPLALALTSGEVVVENCHDLDEYQADSVFIKIIKDNGGMIFWENDGVRCVKSSAMKPLKLWCGGFPDLVPTLAFLAAHIEGESVLHDLETLRHKESDRIFELERILQAFKVDYCVRGDDLIINGRANYKYPYAEFSPVDDHRMVMVSYLFMRANQGGVILKNAEHVKKSFPDFFEVMN